MLYDLYILFLVCIYATPDPCEGNFTYVHSLYHCYGYSFTILYTWREANQFCVARKATLLSLETQEEYDGIITWYEKGNIIMRQARSIILYIVINTPKSVHPAQTIANESDRSE